MSQPVLVLRPGVARYRNHIGLAVMFAGIFVTVMDGAIVNVAIPSIRTTLGATFAEAELVIVGYIFIFAIGMITGGRLGDIFGQRRIFLVGFAAFTVTSALCCLARWHGSSCRTNRSLYDRARQYPPA